MQVKISRAAIYDCPLCFDSVYYPISIFIPQQESKEFRKGYMNMALSKSQLEKYADVLIWGLTIARKNPFKPYDLIAVFYDPEALPLAEVLHRKLIRQKRNVVLRVMPNPGIERNFYLFSDRAQRRFAVPGEAELYSSLNGRIYLHAPSSLTHLKDIDAGKINDVLITRKPLRSIMNRREDQGKLGWTLCTYPTAELAARAGMSPKEYSAQIVRACFLNAPDPVGIWNDIHSQAAEIKKWLGSLAIRTLVIESASMDLKINLGENRIFSGISGRNIPSFEIFTSPDWRGASGIYHADQPSYRDGNLIEGITLRFEKGRVTKITAGRGGEFARRLVKMDAGARRIGEFSLTDRRFSRISRFMADTLYDENYGGRYGNCHIALGSSYSSTFSGNPSLLSASLKKKLGFNESALHWDLVNTENKTVSAANSRGKKIILYEKGKFVY